MTIETAQTAIVRLGGHPSIRSRRTLTAVAMIAVLAALPAGAAAQDTGAASCAPAEHAGVSVGTSLGPIVVSAAWCRVLERSPP